MKNKKITFKLKRLNLSDVTYNYLNWFNDREIKKYIINKKYKKLVDLKDYINRINKDPNKLLLGIFVSGNNKHIGNIKFDNINNRTVNLGILIGDKKFRNRRIGSHIIDISVKHLNKRKNIKNFILGVKKTNLLAINSYKKSGFRFYKNFKNYMLMKLDLDLLNLNKISIGSAQFGMKYGINNKLGKPSLAEIKKILNFAEKLGIRNIDTAVSYGKSEEVLGKAGVKNFKITSKLPFIASNKKNYIQKIVKKSLMKLKKRYLENLLIHNSKNLNVNTGKILSEMRKLKKKGMVKQIGASITNLKDLVPFLKNHEVDIIQVPYNILDRRIEKNEIKNILLKKNIKVQIRSIFLQGLLFKKFKNLDSNFQNMLIKNKKIKKFLNSAKSIKITKMLNLPYNYKNCENIIIGIERLKQLEQISKIKKVSPYIAENLKTYNDKIINPSLWNKRT